MRSAPVLVPLALLAAAGLSGCAVDSATPTPTAVATSSTPVIDPSAAERAGAALKASGGFTARVEGTYSCTTAGTAKTLAMTAGATSLAITTDGGKVIRAAYSTVGHSYTGTDPAGLPGSLTIEGTTATVRGVRVPATDGSPALVLDGMVTCR